MYLNGRIYFFEKTTHVPAGSFRWFQRQWKANWVLSGRSWLSELVHTPFQKSMKHCSQSFINLHYTWECNVSSKTNIYVRTCRTDLSYFGWAHSDKNHWIIALPDMVSVVGRWCFWPAIGGAAQIQGELNEQVKLSWLQNFSSCNIWVRFLCSVVDIRPHESSQIMIQALFGMKLLSQSLTYSVVLKLNSKESNQCVECPKKQLNFLMSRTIKHVHIIHI